MDLTSVKSHAIVLVIVKTLENLVGRPAGKLRRSAVIRVRNRAMRLRLVEKRSRARTR